METAQQKKIFLKANWLRLASANYIVDPAILKKYLPKGTELEAHNGQHFVSLVAFRYCDTRLLNMRIPFHEIFEEINLRFYVKRKIAPGKWRSEVAFTKLYFPKWTLTLVANAIYKENYETVEMRHDWRDQGSELLTAYGLKKDQWHHFEILSTKEKHPVLEHSDEHFFSKHFWGTCKIDEESSTSYNIEHPEWKIYKILDHNISFDFGNVFGSDFKHLQHTTPHSINLFDGSEVIVNRRAVL